VSPAAQLRRIGWLVLLAGFALGGMIYLFGAGGDTAPDENTVSTIDYKKQELDAQRMFGSEGGLVWEITRIFSRASTWSAIIIGVSALIALGCFFMASHPPKHNQEETRGP
jgi:hypothetical protein